MPEHLRRMFGPGADSQRQEEAEIETLKALGAVEIASATAPRPTQAASPTHEVRPAPSTVERPSIRSWVGADKALLALVFTDVVGSTALANRLGNEAMSRVRRAHFERGRDLIERHGGYEVKTIGDSSMVAFRTAVEALDFALAFHQDTGSPDIVIRAGIHIGLVDVEEDDLHGPTVNFAARVESRSVGPEVWTSEEVYRQIVQYGSDRHAGLTWTAHPNCSLKGFPGRHRLWSVQP